MKFFKKGRIRGINRLNFDTWDDLHKYGDDMWELGMSWSPATPYQATCVRCRAVVDTSVPSLPSAGLEYARQHRAVCGEIVEQQ